MNIDIQRSKIIGIDKFDIECKELGINLSEKDLNTLLCLYEFKDDDHHGQEVNLNQQDCGCIMPLIKYDSALQAIVPVIYKNGDRKVNARQN